MRSPGYYALLVANGMKFDDMIELVREEAELDDLCSDCAEKLSAGESGGEASPGVL